MTPCHNIVALAGDPGGAAALAPVLSRLQGDDRFSLRLIAYRQAGEVWTRFNLAFETGCGAFGDEEAAELLRRWGADLLLTATSGAGEFRLEHRLTNAARSLGIPSLALLDFWSDYRARFTGPRGDRLHLPDLIMVMDQQARSEMMEQGFAAERLVVTGQPAFDTLESDRLAFADSAREQLRSSFGLKHGEKFVLFLSQPIGDHYAWDPTSPRYLGYTERQVHEAVIRSLARISERRGQPIFLLIRPHPREKLTAVDHRGTDSPLRVIVTSEGVGRELALAADLVTGMFTVLLIEAYLMRCPVVSLQPGLQGPDLLPLGRSGLVPTVYDGSKMVATLDQFLYAPFQDPSRRTMPWPGDATSKVVETIRLTLRDNGRGMSAANKRGILDG